MHCRHPFLGLLMLSGVLSGCGQSGPLYHPGEKTPYGPPYYSVLHPSAASALSEQKTENPRSPAAVNHHSSCQPPNGVCQ